MRMVYTAFAISSMVDDWSGVNVEKAISFIKSCLVSFKKGHAFKR